MWRRREERDIVHDTRRQVNLQADLRSIEREREREWVKRKERGRDMSFRVAFAVQYDGLSSIVNVFRIVFWRRRRRRASIWWGFCCFLVSPSLSLTLSSCTHRSRVSLAVRSAVCLMADKQSNFGDAVHVWLRWSCSLSFLISQARVEQQQKNKIETHAHGEREGENCYTLVTGTRPRPLHPSCASSSSLCLHCVSDP